jgi:hypothetical protein
MELLAFFNLLALLAGRSGMRATGLPVLTQTMFLMLHWHAGATNVLDDDMNGCKQM